MSMSNYDDDGSGGSDEDKMDDSNDSK